jgi:tripartite-type tricarboxylate transporter receptor subunit TctC
MNEKGEKVKNFQKNEWILIKLKIEVYKTVKSLQIMIGFQHGMLREKLLRTFTMAISDDVFNKGEIHELVLKLDSNPFPSSVYDTYILIGKNSKNSSEMPYDIVEGLTHIGMIAKGPNALVVNPAFPANTLSELVALIKASPGKYNYASTGNGASNHLSMEMLKSAADLNVTHIPYKGGSQALNDLMAGQIPLMFDTMSAVQAVKAGKLKAFAITSDRRSNLLPDVRTVAEAGLPGYKTSSWNGVLVPAGTSKEIVSKLNAEINRILQQSDTRTRFLGLGVEPMSGSPEALGDYLQFEIKRWAKLIKDADIRAE